MKVLKDLAYLINRYQLKEIDVLPNQNKKTTKDDLKYFEAYAGIRENKWKTEAEFAKAMKFKDEKDKSYIRFRDKLVDKMMNTILFLKTDPKDANKFNSELIELIKSVAQVYTMMRRGSGNIIFELAQKCLKSAIDLEQPEYMFLISKFMKPMILRDVTKQDKVFQLNKICDESLKHLAAEQLSQSLYDQMIILFLNKKGFKWEYAATAEAYYEQLLPLSEAHSFIQFQVNFRGIHVWKHTLKHEWKQGLKVAEDTILFCKAKKYPSVVSISTFQTQRVSCLIMLSEFIKAKSIIDENVITLQEGSVTWFKNRELATINAFYSGAYHEAWEITQKIINHERFLEIQIVDQESWQMFNAYLHCMIAMKKITLSPQEAAALKPFRMAQWLNTMTNFSRDKQGSQIPVLILQILFLVTEGKTDDLENRVEALRKYRQRNLDPRSEHFRSDCFIRLLELLPKHGHDRKALENHAAPILDRMSSSSMDILDRTFEIEVVSYELQWAWILEQVFSVISKQGAVISVPS